MDVMRARIWHAAASLLLAPALVHAQTPPPAAAPPEPTHEERQALRDFISSLMRGAIVGACSRHSFPDAPKLQAAYEQWRTPLAASIAKGQQAALTYFADLGADETAQRSNFQQQFDRNMLPGIVQDTQRSCTAALLTVTTGVPVPFRGTTRTSPELRFDVYKQAIVAAGAQTQCRDFDSIDSSVTEQSEKDTGATERWVLHGCGKQATLILKHQPSERGGSGFTLAAEPAPEPKPESPKP